MGLIYSSAESSELIAALSKNLTSAKAAVNQLSKGSRQVILAVDGRTLSGAAYTAAAGLFSDCILPAITRLTTSIEGIEQELETYKAEDSLISSEGYLDEDNLRQQLKAIKEMKLSVDITCTFVKSQTRTTLMTNVLDIVVDFQKNLREMSEKLQRDMNELEGKLYKLQAFSKRTNGLFSNSLSDMTLAMQAVLLLNKTVVRKDGTYTFPSGVDKSWFQQLH